MKETGLGDGEEENIRKGPNYRTKQGRQGCCGATLGVQPGFWMPGEGWRLDTALHSQFSIPEVLQEVAWGWGWGWGARWLMANFLSLSRSEPGLVAGEAPATAVPE